MSSTSLFNSVTSATSSVVDSVDRNVTRGLRFLGNSYIHNTLLVIFILYAAHFAPKLNLPFLHVLDNYAVKFICVFLLAYLLSTSVKVSLVAALVVVVGSLVLKKVNKQENMVNRYYNKEKFSLDTLTSEIKSKSEGALNYGSEIVTDVKSGAEGVLNYGSGLVTGVRTRAEEALEYGENKLGSLRNIGSGMLNKAESLLEAEPVAAETVHKAVNGVNLNTAAAADHSGTLGKDLNTDAIKKLQKVVEEQAQVVYQVDSESSQETQEPVGVCMGRTMDRGDTPSGWNVDLDDVKYDDVKGYTSMNEEREYSPF